MAPPLSDPGVESGHPLGLRVNATSMSPFDDVGASAWPPNSWTPRLPAPRTAALPSVLLHCMGEEGSSGLNLPVATAQS